MYCPKCGDLSKVVDSRLNGPGRVRRRRQCLGCGQRFSTLEMPFQEQAEIIDVPKLQEALNTLDLALDKFRQVLGGWK